MTPSRTAQEARTPEDTPHDGFGAGYLAYSIRTDFRDLCRLVGRENARQEIAEIINAEFERSPLHGTENH